MRPLGWIQAHPKSVPSSFLGASTPTRANNENSRFSQTIKLSGANGTPKDVWAHLDDLLCISWGSLGDQVDCSSRPVRQPRWILKQLHDADLQVNVEKFDILRTSTEYLEVLTNKRPQSNKAQTQLQFNRPKRSDNKTLPSHGRTLLWPLG